MSSLEIAQPHPDTIIWRYISYDKLIDMEFSRSLFFTQAKQFHDLYEGSPAMVDIGPIEGTSLEAFLKKMYNAPNGPRTYMTISCWSINNYQSTQMWDTYLKKDGHYRGVVIQSTIGRLKASIQDYDKKRIISGAVNYYVRPQPSPGQTDSTGTNMFFHKRPEFADEREYRLLYRCHQLMNLPSKRGALLPVDLKTLIQKIYAPSGIAVQYVANMILRRWSIPVERTTIFDPPPY